MKTWPACRETVHQPCPPPFVCSGRPWEGLGGTQRENPSWFHRSGEGGQVSAACCGLEPGLISSFGDLGIYWRQSVSLSRGGLCWERQRNSRGLGATARRIALLLCQETYTAQQQQKPHNVYFYLENSLSGVLELCDCYLFIYISINLHLHVYLYIIYTY